MRDYAELVKALRYCGDSDRQGCAKECRYGKEHPSNFRCIGFLFADAADAIEELLAAVHSAVHCKDCKWCHAGYCEKYDDLIPWGCANKPWEDWFCADGKRPEPPKEVE